MVEPMSREDRIDYFVEAGSTRAECMTVVEAELHLVNSAAAGTCGFRGSVSSVPEDEIDDLSARHQR
jgi:hypothetical protein